MIEVGAQAPFDARVVTWRQRAGELVCTIVAKATFVLQPGECEPAPSPIPVFEADQHRVGSSSSLFAPSDMVPFKPSAEVTLSGSAYAPGGKPAVQALARLAVGTVDKTLEAWCPRHFGADRGLVVGAKQVSFPIEFELAARGPSGENPVGVDTGVAVPNLQFPGHPVLAPGDYVPTACFGAIAQHWPSRQRLLRPGDRAWLEQPSQGILQPGFNATFFQCTPLDQRCDWPIQAHQRIVLEGLHPTHDRLSTSLPGLEPRAIVVSPREEMLPMVADLMHIDTDRQLVSVTWRTQVRLREGDALRVIVAACSSGQEITYADVNRMVEETLGKPQAPRSKRASVHPPAEQPGAGKDRREERPVPAQAGPLASQPPAVRTPPRIPTAAPSAPTLPPSIGPGALHPSSGQRLASTVPPRPAPGPAAGRPSAPPSTGPRPAASEREPDAHKSRNPALRPAPSAEHPDRPASSPPPAQRPPSIVPPMPPAPIAPTGPALEGAHSAPTGAPVNLRRRSTIETAVPPRTENTRPSVVLSEPRAGRRALVEVLHFSPALLPRLERDAAFANASEHEGEHARIRRVLSKQTPEDGITLRGYVDRMLSDMERMEMPLAVVEGELWFLYDETETLRLSVAVARPLATMDERLAETVRVCDEMLQSTWPPRGDIASTLIERLETDAAQLPVPTRYISDQVQRAMLEERRFRRRNVFGTPHLRADLVLPRSERPVVAYVEASTAEKLPLLPSVPVLGIGELRPREDATEDAAEAFLFLAIGRRLDVAT